jgi:hypothetical protein
MRLSKTFERKLLCISRTDESDNWSHTMKAELVSDTIGEYCRRYGEEDLLRTIEIRHPDSSENFIKRLYKELNAIIDGLERSASFRQDDPEDRITIDVVLSLRRAGYYATHDEFSKGHSDITVTQDSYKWLGEAKIHKDYAWLLEGLNQLQKRYATGREAGSGLLIYIKGSNAQAVLDEWRRRLEEKKDCNLLSTEDADKEEKLVFWSSHTHEGSGLQIRTKHLGVSLYHSPKA